MTAHRWMPGQRVTVTIRHLRARGVVAYVDERGLVRVELDADETAETWAVYVAPDDPALELEVAP